jgi:hypothetical protein
MKNTSNYLDTTRGSDLQIEQYEIVTDQSDPTTVEIYVLDQLGNRIEGGTFRMSDFAHAVYRFYNTFY